MIKNDKELDKRVVYIFSVIVLIAVTVLLVAFITFYKDNVYKKSSSLVYVFEPSTIDYLEPYEVIPNTKEQYKSYGISYGIDVSEWQGVIDWDKVSKTGIKFAMIRCGFREIVGDNIKEDSNFKRNIEGAINAGLRVGVYFFGAARDTKEAEEEAEFTLSLIKDYDISYPIVYDIETPERGRLKDIKRHDLTNNVLTYINRIEQSGYKTMVYSNKGILENKLDTGLLDNKDIWLAHFIDKTDYLGDYDMWQYTNSGKVDGIKGNVDINISYFEYVEKEKDIKRRPTRKTDEDIIFTSVNDSITLRNGATIKNSPKKNYPNRVEEIEDTESVFRIGKSSEFSKIMYEGQVRYIENKDII